MKILLVRITKDDKSWKGTWYRKGQEYFVQQDPKWPEVSSCRYISVPYIGGINEKDCKVLHNPLSWFKCELFKLTKLKDHLAKDKEWQDKLDKVKKSYEDNRGKEW